VLCQYCWDKYIPFPVYIDQAKKHETKNICQILLIKAFPIKNGFKIKMFKISLKRDKSILRKFASHKNSVCRSHVARRSVVITLPYVIGNVHYNTLWN